MFKRLYLFFATIITIAYFIAPSLTYFTFSLGVSFPYALVFTSLGIFLVFFRIYLWSSGKLPTGVLGALTWLTLFFISMRAAVGYWEVYAYDPEGYIKTLPLAVVYPFIMFLGGEAAALNLDRFCRSLWLGFLILAVTVLWGTYLGFINSGYFYVNFVNYQTDTRFNYQTLGDALAIVALMLLSPGQRGLFVLGAFATGFLLLLTYSRTSLLAFLGVWAVRGVLSWKLPTRFRLDHLLRAGMVASLVFLFLFFYVWFLGQEFGQVALSRYQSLVSLEDESVNTRIQLFSEFTKLVEKYGLLGRFMYEVQEGGRGMYVHSVLSYWLEYGVLVFLLVLTILGLSFFKVVKSRHPASPLALNLLVFVVLSVLFSRSYVWPYLWFALGFASALYQRRTS